MTVYGPYDLETWNTMKMIKGSLDKYVEWGYDKYEKAYSKERRIMKKMVNGEL